MSIIDSSNTLIRWNEDFEQQYLDTCRSDFSHFWHSCRSWHYVGLVQCRRTCLIRCWLVRAPYETFECLLHLSGLKSDIRWVWIFSGKSFVMLWCFWLIPSQNTWIYILDTLLNSVAGFRVAKMMIQNHQMQLDVTLNLIGITTRTLSSIILLLRWSLNLQIDCIKWPLLVDPFAGVVIVISCRHFRRCQVLEKDSSHNGLQKQAAFCHNAALHHDRNEPALEKWVYTTIRRLYLAERYGEELQNYRTRSSL